MSYEEEDTCMSYDEEDKCMSFEEEDACMSYEEDTYLGCRAGSASTRRQRLPIFAAAGQWTAPH
jgi:hypothetical protein